MAFICYNKANLKGVTMKITLQKQDKELIHNMFAISKKILKLTNHLFELEINNQKNTQEYKKYQEYLTICEEIEASYYQKINITKIEEYIYYSDIADLFSVFSDYDLIINDFSDLYFTKRVFNKLNQLKSSYLIKLSQEKSYYQINSIAEKLLLKQIIDEEIKNLFAFLTKQETNKDKNNSIKDNLINISYIIYFLNPNLIKQEQKNIFYGTLPAFLNTFEISKKDYNFLLYIFFQRYIKSAINNIIKIEDLESKDIFQILRSTLFLNLIKAFLLVDKNNLNKYQTNIYDIISTSNDEKVQEKIKQILEEVKNSQNVILIDIERLFNNEDSKRF